MAPSPQKLAPPRGMRDFYPQDMLRQNRLFDNWRQAALASGFEHYDACVVESLELLERKAGEEIANQIYAFTDKSGRRLALRPEMTPTLARMIAARQGGLAFPLKWFTIAQCFRYERMTRGRKREHYQWNLDIVGEPDLGAEVEILNTAVTAMRNLNVPDTAWRIHISHRGLLSELLSAGDIPAEHHNAVFLTLDKRGKIPVAEIREMLTLAGVDDAAADRILALQNLHSLEDVIAIVGDRSPAVIALQTLFERLKVYGLEDLIHFDLGVIRGLAYYTGIVFEAFDASGKNRAIFGGGRYDNLLNQVGGLNISAVGLGFGDVVINDLLAGLEEAAGSSSRSGLRIGFMTEAERISAMQLAADLRAAGQAVELATAPQKPKAFFVQADKSGQSEAIFIGPDDVARGECRRKNMATRTESVLPLRA